jgi:A/G-specific adenine glycosylase
VIDKESILYKWACHDDASFHDFSPKQAFEIRESLLTWYRANRRKLPWRGDSPPYDGSTAGVNSGKAKGGQKQMTSIRNFFAPKESTDSASKEQVVEETAFDAAEALPVTGYGVWVSEIMLQQTRVEAVIPYYLKCTFLSLSPLLILVTLPHLSTLSL